MGRIVVHENVTLDGVMQDPTGDEGYAAGGWFDLMPEGAREEWGAACFREAQDAVAWLIGRGTYQWFAERWADREGAWADRLRELPKYVVSGTLADAAGWANSTVLTGDPAQEAERLRKEADGDVLVYGSRPLARMLLERGLVDELRLTTHPFVLGEGERLLDAGSARQSLRLVDARGVGGYLAMLAYRPVRDS